MMSEERRLTGYKDEGLRGGCSRHAERDLKENCECRAEGLAAL